MASNYDYHLAIIGGGAAGLTAARFANQLGKRVALIEAAGRTGGDCTWTGCVPSKALLRAAQAAAAVRDARQYGITVGAGAGNAAPAVSADFAAVMQRIRAVINRIYAAESPAALRAAGIAVEGIDVEGIDVIDGRAQFQDARTLAVGARVITAKAFLICAGASPVIPPIPGLNATPYLTYESFWELETLPQRLVIIGGGPVGCELAQAGQRLGAQVALIEAQPRILPDADPDAAKLAADALRNDGVELRLSASVQSVRLSDGDGGRPEIAVATADGGADDSYTDDSHNDSAVVGDALLIAVGRRPNTAGLGLDAAGVACDANGIIVNNYLRTSVRHIYAAGDCISGGPQFTHYAGYQGAMAVRNALLPGKTRAHRNPQQIPWAVFTDPEIAQAGYTAEQAQPRYGSRIRTTTLPMASIDRAVIDGQTTGFIKAVHLSNGRIIGATIVGTRAAELAQEWIIAIDHGLRLKDLASTLHPYPSLATGSQQLAWEAYQAGMTTGWRGRLLRWLSG